MIAEGNLEEIEDNPYSQIGPFLAETAAVKVRRRIPSEDVFKLGKIHLSTAELHTVKPLEVDIPKGRLTVVTGVSGSGKTTLILESLIPGLEAAIQGKPLPEPVRALEAEHISQVKLIDATPIGINVRSTVATYANIHDELRKVYARGRRRQNTSLFRRGFFLQYRQTALSDLRWNGHDQPRRPIFAGCGNSLPGLPGVPGTPKRRNPFAGARIGNRTIRCRN